VGPSFFPFVTMHTFHRQRDRQTEGWTEMPSQYRALHCSRMVKIRRICVPLLQLGLHFQNYNYSQLSFIWSIFSILWSD